MLCGQRKSHRTRTKQWNPSLMFSSITHNCIPAIICSQHTRLVNRNRLCFYRYSHTFLIADLFVSYHIHLVILNRFCCLVSTQIVHPSEPHAVYRTHLWSGWPFLLCCLITNSSSEWTVCYVSHTPSSGCPFLLFLLIANSSLDWTVCPSSRTQIKPELCLMHLSSQTFYTFLTVFIQHRLWLLHLTQFRQRVFDRSVALAASRSSDTSLIFILTRTSAINFHVFH